VTALDTPLERFTAPALLPGKVVLVAGVGPDLGRSLAVRSAQAGADVVLAARTVERLDAVAAEITALGRRTLPIATDLADAGAREEMVERALAEFGRVDVLLSSAYVARHRHLLEEDLEDMRARSLLNVLSPLGLIQLLAPALTAVGGSVVLINSMVIRNALPLMGAYRMDKAALLAVARGLSVELGPRGVRVNSVAPGYIWADKVKARLREQAEARGITEQALHDELFADVDLRRMPTPDEIADAAVFLASDMASGITGQCLDVNCGQAHH
jgi:NAD(P)-dependent dehydrogenase (short-subunit alcohol dehydrogenase family)